MLNTLNTINFKSDNVKFNNAHKTPQMPEVIDVSMPDDTLILQDENKKAEKKEKSRDRWYKAGVLAQIGIAIGIIGTFVIPLLAAKAGATKINYKDVTNEKSFDELFLSDEMKKVVERLKTSVERAEWIKKKGGNGGSGIMLYGGPGGGKNVHVYAMTKYLQELFPGSKLIMMDVLKFKGMFNGQTENNIIGFVENVIKEAKTHPKEKFVVFLDEFDSIARKDASINATMTESFQNAFKTKLLDLTSIENIQVIAATNKASKDLPLNQLLDDAILNRFPTKIFVPLPTKEQFKEAFVGHYKSLPKELVDTKLTDINNKELDKICEYIAKDNHQASFRNYNYILEEARMISEAKDRTPGSPITMEDLKKAVKQHAESENWEAKTGDIANTATTSIPSVNLELGIKTKAKTLLQKIMSFFNNK
ncbi:ATP-binding protein [bacterium]|nr:ATP-binding protein [bacterium]